MNQSKFKCIIWGVPLDKFSSQVHLSSQNPQGYRPYFRPLSVENKYEIYNLRAGGKYLISGVQMKSTTSHNYETMGVLGSDGNPRDLSESEKVKISGYIAQENLRGNTPDLDELTDDKNWIEKLPSAPQTDEQEILLLRGLVKCSRHLGDDVTLTNIGNDLSVENSKSSFLYAISYCSNLDEIDSLLESLGVSKDVKKRDYAGGPCQVEVTAKGRKRLEKFDSESPNIDSKTAFIAMWMSSSTECLAKSIKRAVESAGYTPLRIDDKISTDKIDDGILVEIQKAKFVVCDITAKDKNEPRASVFFEAGYAKGKNIPVIWSCNKIMKEMQKEVFDTRQYYFIFWDKDRMDEFEKELQKRIEEDDKIGKGPLKGGGA